MISIDHASNKSVFTNNNNLKCFFFLRFYYSDKYNVCNDEIRTSFWYPCFIISYYTFNLLHNLTIYFEKCQTLHCSKYDVPIGPLPHTHYITQNNENTQLRRWNVEIMKPRMQKVESTMTSPFTSKARPITVHLLVRFYTWQIFFQKGLFII
jgi:hypothetical protein